MAHYDHIPAGKKEFFNKETKEWELADLDKKNPEDLQIMLEEKDARISELEAEVANLKLHISKHSKQK